MNKLILTTVASVFLLGSVSAQAGYSRYFYKKASKISKIKDLKKYKAFQTTSTQSGAVKLPTVCKAIDSTAAAKDKDIASSDKNMKKYFGYYQYWVTRSNAQRVKIANLKKQYDDLKKQIFNSYMTSSGFKKLGKLGDQIQKETKVLEQFLVYRSKNLTTYQKHMADRSKHKATRSSIQKAQNYLKGQGHC